MGQGQRADRGMIKKLIAVLGMIALLCIFSEKVHAYEPETLYVYYYQESGEGDMNFAYLTSRLCSAFTPGQRAYIVFESLFRNGDARGWPLLPRNVSVVGAAIVDETLTLNLSEEVLRYGGTAFEKAFVAQLAMNALTFPEVKRLTLLIQGERSPLPEGSILYEREITDLL